jgi:maleylpyruvate isomerase
VNKEMLVLLDDAMRRLAGTTAALGDDEITEASLLPGWSRGHVLTHVARNADALRNLLIWARTGVMTPAYASQRARDEAIEAGARRKAGELLADVTESADAFRAEAVPLPPAAWQATVSLLDGVEFPATQLLTKRLVEVELHHTDLGCGYRRADWPAAFATMDLPEPMRTLRATRQLPARDDQFQGREVGTEPALVARQQPVTGHRRVRADIEVRHRRSLVPAISPVPQKCLPRREASPVRQRLALVVAGREKLIEFLHGLVAD